MSKLPWVIAFVASVLAVALFMRVLSLEKRLAAVAPEPIRNAIVPAQGIAFEIAAVNESLPPEAKDASSAPVTRVTAIEEIPTSTVPPEDSAARSEEQASGIWTNELLPPVQNFVTPPEWDQIMEYRAAEGWAERKYEWLFNQLDLPSDVYQKVLPIFASEIAERHRRYGIATDATFGEHQAIYNQSVAAIDRRLTRLLSEEALDAWRTFEAEREEREMREGYEMMFMSMQPDFPPDIRVLAADLLAEEVIAARLAFANAPMNHENSLAVYENATNSVWTRVLNDDRLERPLTSEQAQALDEALTAVFDHFAERSREN